MDKERKKYLFVVKKSVKRIYGCGNAMVRRHYEKELTDDLISIIHYYSMKSYSMRRRLHKAELVLSSDSEDVLNGK